MTTFSSQPYDVAILTSSARTATTNSDTFENTVGALGIQLYLNVTAASGTGGLTTRVQTRDCVTQNWVTLFTATTAVTAVTTGSSNGGTAEKIYVMDPRFGSSTTPGGGYTEHFRGVLPRYWRVQVAAGDSSSYTYSVAATLLPS